MNQTLGENLQFRWSRAKAAFMAAMGPSPDGPNGSQDIQAVVGWLYPLNHCSPALSCELTLQQTKLQILDESFNVKVTPGSLILQNKKGETQSYYHGDTVQIGSLSFRLSLLSARAHLKWFSSLTLMLVLGFLDPGGNSSSFAAETKAKPSTIVYESQSSDQAGIAQALYRSSFEASLLIPGLTDIDKTKVTSALLADGKPLALPILQARQRRAHYFIQVDVSSLCLLRKKEQAINVELKRFLSSLPAHSLASLSTFYAGNGRIIHESIFQHQKISTLADRVEFIQCHPHSESANALEAMDLLRPILRETQVMEEKEGNSDWWRRALVIFTSGNISVRPSSEALLREYDLDFYPVVYSPIKSPVTESVLTELAAVNEGQVFWWNDSAALNLWENFPFLWSFEIFADLPHQLEEKTYPLEIQYQTAKALYRVKADVQYFQDKRAYFFYRLRQIVLWLGSILLLLGLVYKIVNYYRIKFCPKTRLPMSHHWNQSLFSAHGRYPVLLVVGPNGFEKAHVINKRSIQIGKSFTHDLRLRPLATADNRGLTIKQRGYETFELSTCDKKPFNLSGLRRKAPTFLQHGDWFNFGEFKIQFFAPNESEARS